MIEGLKEIKGVSTLTKVNSIAQEVRFRCPHCQKLYCTQNDVFVGHDPHFDCISCEKSFFLSSELNEIGLYKTNLLSEAQFSNCPKCSHLKPLQTDECPSCGILVSKYEEMQKSESPALFELNQLWQKVMVDFTSEEAHQKFINACHQKMALNFAFKKYSELKTTMGFDLACEHYMKQVELRLESQFKSEEASYSNHVSKRYLSKAQTIFLGVGLFGVLSLIFNKVRPTFPNLTGLVVAITVLSFGFLFFSTDDRNIKLK
jgi:hypothetical protein